MKIHDLFDLTGKIALVTGASRGLGAAAAEVLADAGASVVITGRHAATLEESAASLRLSTGSDILPLVCDMAHPEEIRATVANVNERFGRVDILVNNAGIIRRNPAADYSLEDWNDVVNVDLTAPFLAAQEVGRGMIERRSGKIINIASLLSFSGGLNVVAYTSSKSGIVGLTRALANEWGGKGLQVNAIAPGYFHTEATSSLQKNSERYNALLARIPAGRWGEPDDLQGTILFLASRASDYVNGETIVVDGGWRSN